VVDKVEAISDVEMVERVKDRSLIQRSATALLKGILVLGERHVLHTVHGRWWVGEIRKELKSREDRT